MKCGVYKITNLVTGKFYLGSSQDIDKRLERHFSELRAGVHHCVYLQRSWNKHGAKAFKSRVLRYCKTPNAAKRLEQKYLDKDSIQDSLYNVSRSASGGNLIGGLQARERSKLARNHSARMTALIDSLSEAERIERFGRPGKANGMYGKSHSKAARRAISEANTGNQYATGSVRSEEQRALLSENGKRYVGKNNPFYGKSHTEATRKTLSKANKGKLPPNTRKVRIDGVVYVSCTEAGKKLKVSTATITYRIGSSNAKYKGYKYVT